ncbi:hypothetical protein IT412_02010 [Candidatus Peregrinibacteria bacterium]|nr:hypothetical protein [Candidatus Peregrinibacteria bacterium]
MQKYSLENLRSLMAASPAYQQLSTEEKANIEEHIRQNNKPVLLYIYEQLTTEAAAHQISRNELVKQVNRITEQESQSATAEIKKQLT